jgi:succinate-semialdehyde dehydrogenase/glutarate-semialdehyde dehydrogenase
MTCSPSSQTSPSASDTDGVRVMRRHELRYPDTQLFIDGQWVPGASGRVIPVENPATGQQIGKLARADIADLDRALAAAAKGFLIWRNLSAYERAKIMRAAAGLLRERVEAVARNLTLEQGKPLAQAKLEVAAGADVIDWFAGEAPRVYGRVISPRTANVVQTVLCEPVGPVAAFAPWNFPINQVVRKLSAALAAGCSIIVKGPEETPSAPAALVKAFADAGVPAGVINLVYGDPAEISSYLIPHPVIRKITFTGSTPVGKELAAMAGKYMKRATMELGGHAPAVVCDDADLDVACRVLALGKFRNAGQVCVAPTRILVQRGVYDTFVDKFAAAAKALKVGDGLTEGITLGPLANPRRVRAMDALVKDAVEKGAKLVTGGHRVGDVGNFFEPTVLKDVPTTARAMNEEPFGPLALMVPFDTLDEAIAEANRLPFGLAAYGYSRSMETVDRLGSAIEAGMVSINNAALALIETPFGGVKDSGYGSEGGAEAIESYLNRKFVTRV